MSASAGFDFASIPERIQSEVQRAIQRSRRPAGFLTLCSADRLNLIRSQP
jgi:hypothetical protein